MRAKETENLTVLIVVYNLNIKQRYNQFTKRIRSYSIRSYSNVFCAIEIIKLCYVMLISL